MTLAPLAQLHEDHVKSLHSRYCEVLSRFQLDAILLESGRDALKHARDDAHWPLVAEPFFAQWIPASAGYLLISQDGATYYTLKDVSYWDSARPDNGAWARNFFKHEVVPSVKNIRLPTRTVAIGGTTFSTEVNSITPHQELIEALEDLRVSKSPYEVACMKEASRLAWVGHHHLKDLFLKSETICEFDFFLEYLRVTRQSVYETAYDPIVAFGEHAATLHHIIYSKETTGEKNTSFLLDAGARFQHYASDITRTYVKGESSEAKEFARLISGVDAMQQKLCSEFTVGTDYQTLHNRCHELIADLMVESEIAGSIKKSELVESGITRAFLPHGLGHSLGIQVHDIGLKRKKPESRNPFLRNTSVVAEGHVVTVEPGFYFIEQLLAPLRSSARGLNWKAIDRLIPFGGVRVEDNVLATKEGPVNLTRPFETDRK